MRQALVIGGTGFLGLNVVDALLAEGWRVRVTRRRRSPTILLGRRPVQFAPADLADLPSLRAAMQGCDAVFLSGAYYPPHSQQREASLARGRRDVRTACEAALGAGVPRLVFTSSVGALAPAPASRPATELDVPLEAPTDSVYRAVKWAMERELEQAQARGLDAVTVLPGGCIGPGDARVGTGALLVGTVRGALPWWVDGLVNLVAVEDVARAHVRAAAPEVTAGARFCVPGHTVRLGAVLAYLRARFGGVIPAEQLAPDEARARADLEEQQALRVGQRAAVPRELVDLVCTGQRVSGALAERVLQVAPSPLEAAFERAHEWYARFRYLDREVTSGAAVSARAAVIPTEAA